MQKTVLSDVLCRFQVTDSVGDVFQQYSFLTAASSQSGIHRPQQVFVCLVPVDWDFDLCHGIEDDSTSVGLVLDLQTLSFIQPQGSNLFPPQPELAGRLRMFTSDQFAAFLLDLPVSVDAGRAPKDVKADIMHFKDILPRRVVITGVNTDITGLIATPESAPVIGNRNGPVEPEPNQSPAQGPEPVFDLMSMLETSNIGHEPPSKRRRNQTSSKSRLAASNVNMESTSDSVDAQHGDPILDDPCLQTFLSPQDLSDLKAARDECVATGRLSDLQDWDQTDLKCSSGESGDELEDVTADDNTSKTVPPTSGTTPCADSNLSTTSASDSWKSSWMMMTIGARVWFCKSAF